MTETDLVNSARALWPKATIVDISVGMPCAHGGPARVAVYGYDANRVRFAAAVHIGDTLGGVGVLELGARQGFVTAGADPSVLYRQHRLWSARCADCGQERERFVVCGHSGSYLAVNGSDSTDMTAKLGPVAPRSNAR